MQYHYNLVHFEIPVDVFDKQERGEERCCAYHEEEDVAGEDRVTKELHCLKGAVHVRPLVVVKQGIAKHKETGGTVRVRGKERERGRERD